MSYKPDNNKQWERCQSKYFSEASVDLLQQILITLKVKGHYFLVVEAADGAVDPRRSRLTLSVTVLDVDDNSPIFSQQTYNVNLPENSQKDTVILQLKVGVWTDVCNNVVTVIIIINNNSFQY